MRTFIAKVTFHSAETKSTYVRGLSYTIKPGNRYLNAIAEVWALQGKVSFAHVAVKPPIEGKADVQETLMSDDPSIWEKTKKAGRELWQSLTRQR